MKTHTYYNNIIAVRLLVLLVAMLTLAPAEAQDSRQYAIYNYRNDGDFNAWMNVDIDSITYSCIDMLGIEHDEVVVQEVWTPDSVYRIPISAIDSIGFRAPAPVMREGIFYLREYHAAHITATDSLILYFDTNILNDSLPSIGQVVLSATNTTPLEEGFAGRVVSIERLSNSIKMECEMIAVGDVYKRLVLVGKGISESDYNTQSKIRRANGDAWVDFEESNIKTYEKIGDMTFSCLNGMLSVVSKDPTLVVNYYVYVDELFYSMSADVNLIHHDFETHVNLSLSKIIELSEMNKDIGDAMKRLRDFKNVDQWLEDLLKEKIQEENKEKESKDEIDIIEEIWKDLHFSKSIPLAGPLLLDIEVGPLLKFKGDIELDVTLKNKALNTFHLEAKGNTMATLSSPSIALLTGLASVKGHATFEADPYTDGSIDARAKGSLSMGITGKVGLSLIHKDVVHASLGAEAGIKASAALDIKYVDTAVDSNDRTPYEAIKDTKIKLEWFAKASAELGITPSKFFTLEEEWEFWSKDIGVWYLVPHFSKPSLPTYSNGQWSNGNSNNHLVLQSLPSKEIPDMFFGPCKVALRIVDDKGTVVRKTDTREYRDDGMITWQIFPLEIDLTGLTPGKTYRCYPVLNYFNWKPLVASPSYEFTVPQPLSIETNTLTLQKDKAERVPINGGWGDYSVFVLDNAVCSAELKQEGGKWYIQIVGLKDGKSTTVTLKDLRTEETKVVLVSVTNGEITIKEGKHILVSPSSINFGEVAVGLSKTEQFTVRNVGTESVRFKVSEQHGEIDIYDSGTAFTLPSGEEKVFVVSYRPTSANAGFNSRVSVETNAEEGEQFVDFHGSAIAPNYDSVELIFNGDFSLGAVGFTSDYEYVSEKGSRTLWDEGKYAVGTCPRDYHFDFRNNGDHTTGTGNMLIVNGSTDNSKYAWKQTVYVEKGKTYEFSSWFISVSGHGSADKNDIEYYINGTTNLGTYDKTENGWERYYWRYTATKTGPIELKIRTMSAASGGNDFAIDDISFTSKLSDQDVQTEVITIPGTNVSFKMIAVEGGTFWMGSPDDDEEAEDFAKPRHQVTLSSFAIGETEVTQALWEAVMGSNPSYYKGSNLPVDDLDWDDCQEFIAKLNQLTGRTFRLPTEAEWEYAARGGKYSHGYKYAGSDDVDAVAWYWNTLPTHDSDDERYGPQPVATKQPNELGLYDMSGNVWEFCQDWECREYYRVSPSVNPCCNVESSFWATRGGSWARREFYCRVATRDCIVVIGDAYNPFGFRLALSGRVDTPVDNLSCPDDHHPHMIDLGLPSGTKWACCNVDDDHSRQSPTNYGSHYAWGEVKEKDYYDWSTYSHCDGSENTCHNLGSDIAGTQYDVAHVQWGGSWVMPSREQLLELTNNCKYIWITVNGVNGGLFTGPNGATIFLPMAGYRYEDDFSRAQYGEIWSSTQSSNLNYVGYLSLDLGDVSWGGDRCRGCLVRPVINPNGKPDYQDGGNPSDGDGRPDTPGPDADDQGDL